MSRTKVIHDSIHGSVRIEGVFLRLLERPEMQRLMGVRQLGMGHMVFPGANHTRFEHCLGTYALAGKMSDILSLGETDREHVRAAALLHDLGHAPYSHTLEEVLKRRWGSDHMEATTELVMGRMSGVPTWFDPNDTLTIAEILIEEGLDPERVCHLIESPDRGPDGGLLSLDGGQAHFGNHSYLNQIIHGPVDADQMDYLLRDAHYTGVAHGAIDIERILNTISLHHGDLVVDKGGVVAVEGLMVARALMYSSVYFHKTVRIAEMMLCKALDAMDDDMDCIHMMTDADLEQQLLSHGGHSKEIMLRLRYRRLYKRAMVRYTSDLSVEELDALVPLTDSEVRSGVERAIAERCGLHQCEVIIDVPGRRELLCEIRKGKTDVPVLSDGRVRPISRYSPIAKALQTRATHDWAVMVSCPAEHRQDVARAAERMLIA